MREECVTSPLQTLGCVCVCVHVCYLNAVKGSTLLLVQQCVVVGQLHQLVQLFVGVFLLQFLQNSNHLEVKKWKNTLSN